MFSARFGGLERARRSAGLDAESGSELPPLRQHHFRTRFVREARAMNGRSSPEQGPEDRKDNTMIDVALALGWFAVVGLVLIARADYRPRPPIR